MKRNQLINIICSLLLASLLILSAVLAAIFLPHKESIKLIVASTSVQKEYDGTPLVSHSYEILLGELYSGHSILASFSGSQTEIGSSDNIFTLKIVDLTGKDVTDQYEIELVFGKLNVTRQSVNNNPGTGIGSGFANSVGGGSTIDLDGRISSLDGGENNNELCLRVKNQIDDTVYLKVKSFGAYTGNSWQEAVEYTKYWSSVFSASYLASLSLNRKDSVIEIKSFSDQFFLPYYMSYTDFVDHPIQKSDVQYSGNTENVYTVAYGIFDYQKVAPLPYLTYLYEKDYRLFVESQYLEIDEETRTYMEKIAKGNNLQSDNRLATVLRVAEYIKNSAKYSSNYDRNLDAEENIAVAFLDEYKEGICQHYASAATLLFRAIGIPARYTVGFVTDTQADTWVDVRGKSAHAWVEVYIDGMGWIMIEVTNGYQGPGQIDEIEYTAEVTPVLTDKQYDGTPLYAENRVTGFEAYEAMGFTYAAAVNGSRTELGMSKSVIEAFTVYDRNGNDVTKKFSIQFNKGTVHVYYSELVFTSESISKVYDGTALNTDLSTCKMVSGELREGDTIEFSNGYLSSVVSVHSGIADFQVYVLDENQYFANSIYKITKKCGSMTITPREITLRAASAVKVYDGRKLSSYEYSITEGSLADGDSIYSCKIEGSQYEIGYSDNIITNVIITNFYGDVATKNYIIKFEPGTLQVLPQS